jgi:urease accessory protein
MTRIATMITIMATPMAIRTTTPMGTAIRISMTEGTALPLLVWLSPSFPVGAFAYSHGLEWAVEAGDLSDAGSCQAWMADILEFGSGRTDAILLAHAWRAVMAGDRVSLGEVAELAIALQPSAERHLEASAQGNAFMTAARAAWPSEALEFLRHAHSGDVAYPIAVGVAAAGFAMPLHAVLEGFLLGFVTNLVSSAVRLGPIGQTDGQRIIAFLVDPVRRIALEAMAASLDDLGSSAFRSDLASLRHETQYTRLFRS